MKLSSDLLKALKLEDAAAKVTSDHLDRMPLLVSEKALTDASSRLARAANTDHAAGTRISSSTFSMPRKGFGARPVTMLAARDRTLYDALVDRLRPSLPRESRGPEQWETFKAFGLPGSESTAKYVVSLDIASMYEYVDHQVLQRELLVQTLDHPAVEATIALLGEAFSFPRGLPQMMTSSDLLADVYLGVLERELLRQGYRLARYADDFRVLADTWGEAHRIIEHAAESARSIGLVLSSEKTKVRFAKTLQEEEDELRKVLRNYFNEARFEQLIMSDVMNWYVDPDEATPPPTEQEAMIEAFRQVLIGWTSSKDAGIPSGLVSKAIIALGPNTERLSDEVLSKVLWRDQLKLSSIINYLTARSDEKEANRQTLATLTAMERQSPWAKLWLLHAADEAPMDGSEHALAIRKWAVGQLKDEHEVVRAEAAWVLAGWGALSERELAELFGRATRLTRAGLAAALGRSGHPASSSMVKAIMGASSLFKDAYEWGSKHVAAAA